MGRGLVEEASKCVHMVPLLFLAPRQGCKTCCGIYTCRVTRCRPAVVVGVSHSIHACFFAGCSAVAFTVFLMTCRSHPPHAPGCDRTSDGHRACLHLHLFLASARTSGTVLSCSCLCVPPPTFAPTTCAASAAVLHTLGCAVSPPASPWCVPRRPCVGQPWCPVTRVLGSCDDI